MGSPSPTRVQRPWTARCLHAAPCCRRVSVERSSASLGRPRAGIRACPLGVQDRTEIESGRLPVLAACAVSVRPRRHRARSLVYVRGVQALGTASVVTFAPLADRYRSLVKIVERGGRVYPAAVDPAPRGIPLHALLTVARGAGAEANGTPVSREGASHLQAVIRRFPEMFNGPIVALDRIASGGIFARPGTYFDMIATSDVLAAEYLRAASAPGLETTPLRDRADANAGGNPFRQGRGRVAAIGVTVLLLERELNGSGLTFTIGRRRSGLAIDPNCWHVIPSGMIEPGDAPLRAAIYGELREEAGLETSQVPTDAISVLGYGFDLLRLRTEICVAVSLPAATPRDNGSAASAEFSSTRAVRLNEAGLASFWQECSPGTTTPACAAAVALLESAVLAGCN
jgi:8-oxo-dGTP pyrophosphatase MutT (NUDIX family)